MLHAFPDQNGALALKADIGEYEEDRFAEIMQGMSLQRNTKDRWLNQSLCSQDYGVRANLKSEALIDLLLETQ